MNKQTILWFISMPLFISHCDKHTPHINQTKGVVMWLYLYTHHIYIPISAIFKKDWLLSDLVGKKEVTGDS